MRAVLIGVGSPFGDDTLGWQLLDALEDRGLDMPGWEVGYEKADRPGAGLLSCLEGLDAAVVLDALAAGAGPGTLRILRADELERTDGLLSGHALGVAEALALGEKLGMLPARLYLLGIGMGAGPGPGWAEEAAMLIEGVLRQPATP